MSFRDLAPRPAVDFHCAEDILRQLVAPVAERAFGELHDVLFVDEGDALLLIPDGVIDGGVNQTLGAGAADGLNADADFHLGTRWSEQGGTAGKLLGLLASPEPDLPEVLREFG